MNIVVVDIAKVYCIHSRAIMSLCACEHCHPWREPYLRRDYDLILWKLFTGEVQA